MSYFCAAVRYDQSDLAFRLIFLLIWNFIKRVLQGFSSSNVTYDHFFPAETRPELWNGGHSGSRQCCSGHSPDPAFAHRHFKGKTHAATVSLTQECRNTFVVTVARLPDWIKMNGCKFEENIFIVFKLMLSHSKTTSVWFPVRYEILDMHF